MIVIKTQRLLLRHFKLSDLPEMAAISMDKQVMQFFPNIQSLDETRQLLDRIFTHQKQYGYSLYAVESRSINQFIGFIGLIQPNFTLPHFTPKHLPVVEIAWRLHHSFWGQGLATEGAQAVLDYGLNELGLKEIISFTAKINKPSIRVMEKIGLQNEIKDDFFHPKLDKRDPLSHHVLYKKTGSI